jgi:hypothetical protein
MGLLDILQQVSSAHPEAQFDQAVQSASSDQLGAGLAATLRSSQTPAFGETVGQLFGRSSPAQQAGLLNQIIAAVGPAAASALAGGVLGRLLQPGQAQLSPEQASRVNPAEVTQVAQHAEQQHPGIVDEVGRFYAQHAGLVKTLGGAALAVALTKMKDNAAHV